MNDKRKRTMNYSDSHIDIENGKVMNFSPSFIKSWRLCPEKLRLDLLNKVNGIKEVTFDQTVIGTATHAAMEHHLRGGSTDDAVAHAHNALNDEFSKHEVRFNKYQSEPDAHTALDRYCEDLWLAIEFLEFKSVVTVEQPVRFSYGGYDFRGTPDIVEPAFDRVLDLKTGRFSREMNWEHQRYDPQSTIYCHGTGCQTFTFIYLAGLVTESRFELVEVVRYDTEFMDALVMELASMERASCEFNLTVPWPLHPQGWHCSPKWCQSYSSCVGSVLPIEIRENKFQ